jgi:hypothetical protein
MKQTIIKIWQVEVNEPSKALCKQVVLDYANKYPPDEVIIDDGEAKRGLKFGKFIRGIYKQLEGVR